MVELKDVWFDGAPVATAEIDTPGNQKLEVLFFTDRNERFGRYYMKITLCGLDCDDEEVVFDINPDINSPYERTVFEDGEPVPSRSTAPASNCFRAARSSFSNVFRGRGL